MGSVGASLYQNWARTITLASLLFQLELPSPGIVAMPKATNGWANLLLRSSL
jgi:hypothetical protein